MKLKDLIQKLQKLDGELDVFGWSEDPQITAPGHGFRLLDLEEVTVTEGEVCRVDEIPSFKLGASPHSKKIVALGMTANF